MQCAVMYHALLLGWVVMLNRFLMVTILACPVPAGFAQYGAYR